MNIKHLLEVMAIKCEYSHKRKRLNPLGTKKWIADNGNTKSFGHCQVEYEKWSAVYIEFQELFGN